MATGLTLGKRPEHGLENEDVLDELEQGASKKGRQGNVFTDFPERLKKKLDNGLAYFIDADFYDQHPEVVLPCVTVLKLINCNAAGKGASFSKAYCEVERCIPARPFALLFTHGINVLINYIKKGSIPENRQLRFVLSRLLKFIVNNMDAAKGKDQENPLVNLENFGDKTELAIALANHLFGKLSASEEFMIDIHWKWKGAQKCPCSNSSCTLTGQFGDTSIGNKEVWHGNLDIIINNLVVVQSLEDELDEEHSPGGKSSVEVMSKSGSAHINEQIIPEVIVFSFLQKKRHPENDHFLVPCIGITGKDIVVYFYDSEHDVLLESCRLDILNHATKLNLTAVIIAWLVVNYKYTCSGLESDMMGCKSGFFSLAKAKLEIYKNNVTFGHVGKASHQFQPVSALPIDSHLLKDRFKYD